MTNKTVDDIYNEIRAMSDTSLNIAKVCQMLFPTLDPYPLTWPQIEECIVPYVKDCFDGYVKGPLNSEWILARYRSNTTPYMLQFLEAVGGEVDVQVPFKMLSAQDAKRAAHFLASFDLTPASTVCITGEMNHITDYFLPLLAKSDKVIPTLCFIPETKDPYRTLNTDILRDLSRNCPKVSNNLELTIQNVNIIEIAPEMTRKILDRSFLGSFFKRIILDSKAPFIKINFKSHTLSRVEFASSLKAWLYRNGLTETHTCETFNTFEGYKCLHIRKKLIPYSPNEE